MQHGLRGRVLIQCGESAGFAIFRKRDSHGVRNGIVTDLNAAVDDIKAAVDYMVGAAK